MSAHHQQRTVADADDVAEQIVAAFAADNKGVAEVIPADEVRSRLEAVVAESERFDEDDREDLYVDVKDAILARDVVIA